LKGLLEIEVFYYEFLKLIPTYKTNEIDCFQFRFSSVLREEGRIDVVIFEENLKKAIIIENKINNAVDTYRQIPTYYNNCIGKKYEVKSIVYLTLCGGKLPDKSTWTEEDKKNVDNLILNCKL